MNKILSAIVCALILFTNCKKENKPATKIFQEVGLHFSQVDTTDPSTFEIWDDTTIKFRPGVTDFNPDYGANAFLDIDPDSSYHYYSIFGYGSGIIQNGIVIGDHHYYTCMILGNGDTLTLTIDTTVKKYYSSQILTFKKVN